MKKEVTVIEVNGKQIRLGCDSSSCEGCQGSFFCTAKNTSFVVENNKDLKLKSGDKVVLEMDSKKTVFSVFLSFGLPLILFIPGYYIGNAIFSSEAASFLSALCGVALGFLIAGLYFKIRKRIYKPEILEKKV